ncbi:hypothetical protein ACSNOI_29850 [Actinomadura kijaniata]|uniref:hypothetical protein n=1 Tax=Actinomadura kijaniata TaxID=46161 RepID=UPI003F1C199D
MTQMEPSILDHASSPGALEDVTAAAGGRLQQLMSAATGVANAIGQARAERLRQRAAQLEAEQRAEERRQRAMGTVDRVGQRTALQGETDRATSDRAAPDHAEGTSDVGRGGDTASQAEPVLKTITCRVRDGRAGLVLDEQIIHLAADEGESVALLVAADRLIDFQRRHGAADRDLVVETVVGRDSQPGARLHVLDVSGARQLLDAHTALRDQSFDWAQHKGRTGEERLSADQAAQAAALLRFERRRLRQMLRGPGPGADGDQQNRGAQPPHQPEAIRQRLGQIALLLEAVEAEQRGEDGTAVIQAAILRTELNEQWWREAEPSEVATVLQIVASWSPGKAQEQMLRSLGSGIAREFQVPVPAEASAEQLDQLLQQLPPRRAAASHATMPPQEAAAEHASDRQPAQGPGAGDDQQTRARRQGAAQNRAAAQIYEQQQRQGTSVVQEAAEAARTAMRSWLMSPSARLNHTTRHVGDSAAVPSPPARSQSPAQTSVLQR